MILKGTVCCVLRSYHRVHPAEVSAPVPHWHISGTRTCRVSQQNTRTPCPTHWLQVFITAPNPASGPIPEDVAGGLFSVGASEDRTGPPWEVPEQCSIAHLCRRWQDCHCSFLYLTPARYAVCLHHCPTSTCQVGNANAPHTQHAPCAAGNMRPGS
jgi:hypothetical protein